MPRSYVFNPSSTMSSALDLSQSTARQSMRSDLGILGYVALLDANSSTIWISFLFCSSRTRARCFQFTFPFHVLIPVLGPYRPMLCPSVQLRNQWHGTLSTACHARHGIASPSSLSIY